MCKWLSIVLCAAFFPLAGATAPWDDITRVLADQRISPEWRDGYGRGAAYYHLVFGSEDRALWYLRQEKDHGRSQADDYLLDVAVMVGSQRVVQWLTDAGASMRAGERDSASPLMLAAEAGHLEIMRMLLRKGADPDASIDGMTAAHFAVRGKSAYSLSLLLDSGLDLQRLRRDKSGFNLLFFAIESGNRDSIETLIARDFRPNEPRRHGESPLHLASSTGQVEVIRLLLEAGADPCLLDSRRQTPIDRYQLYVQKRFGTQASSDRGPFGRRRCAKMKD